MHAGSDKKFEVPLKWLPDGSAESDWKIPFGGKPRKLPALNDSSENNRNFLRKFPRRIISWLPILAGKHLHRRKVLVCPTDFSCGLQVSDLSRWVLDLKVKSGLRETHTSGCLQRFRGYVFSKSDLVKEGISSIHPRNIKRRKKRGLKQAEGPAS